MSNFPALLLRMRQNRRESPAKPALIYKKHGRRDINRLKIHIIRQSFRRANKTICEKILY